jgi:hypothetical protein
MEPEGWIAFHGSPSLAPIESNDSIQHPDSLRSVLMTFFHLRIGLLSGPFPSGFPTKIVYAFLIFPSVWKFL